MLIQDVVQQNSNAAFENDVQLSWYPNHPSNGALAGGFMFTSAATEGKKSSIDLLDRICLSFTYDKANRLTVIANYGHGKSHFALALANFFGKPSDSAEVKSILYNIEHASNPSMAARFQDFKQGRTFLVVRLRGDIPDSLPKQFLSGLETALSENPATAGVELPFWTTIAEKFLKGLTPEEIAKASDYLRTRNVSLPVLIQRIEKHDTSLYELCRSLSGHLYPAPLDFKGETSLDEALKWVVGEYCGDGKPVGGVLILFDEFGAFIRDYAHRSKGGNSSALQDLLNGVNNCKGKACIVAFSQVDPDTVAENAYRTSGDTHGLDSLKKELNRLPTSDRYSLYSSLETVLDAYLRQDTTHWQQLYQQTTNAFDRATNFTLRLFSQRYDARMGWGEEKVFNILTEGCFPLHPVTTALLCSVQFREVTAPRTVLGFVLEALRQRSAQEALINGKPNWVYPVELVEWFREMLADREWEQYLSARQGVGAAITPCEEALLKAIFLQTVGQLNPGALGFGTLIATLTGLSPEDCDKGLKELADGGYIRYDSEKKAYGFWTGGGGSGNVLEKAVNQAIQSKKLDGNDLLNLNEFWQRGDRTYLGPIPVDNLAWGHEEDYAARQHLLSRSLFTPQKLRVLMPPITADNERGFSAARGHVIHLLALNDEDVDYYRENASKILAEAFHGTITPPMVVALPKNPNPLLPQRVLKQQALENLGTKLRELNITPDVVAATRQRYADDVRKALVEMRQDVTYIVPAVYQSHVQVAAPQDQLEAKLKACYAAAYPDGPPAYKKQMKTNTPNLRKASMTIARSLAGNSLGKDESTIIANNGVARDIIQQTLKASGQLSWGLVSHDGLVHEPTNARVRRAWKYLDDVFVTGTGTVPLKQALVGLLNAPFGYDFNQATVLFAAWYGNHRYELRFHQANGSTNLRDFLNVMMNARDSRPEDFIKQVCYVYNVGIERRKPVGVESIRTIINSITQRINRGERLTVKEAESTIKTLHEFTANEQNDEVVRGQANGVINRLEDGLRKKETYESAARELQERIKNLKTVRQLMATLKQVESLPSTGCIAVDEDLAANKISDAGKAFFAQLVEGDCQRYEGLERLEDYSLFDSLLKALETNVKEFGDSVLVQRVKRAITRFEERHRILDAGRQDAAIIARISAYKTEKRLKYLRDNIKEVKSEKPIAQATRETIAGYITTKEESISQAERFIKTLPGRIESLTTVKDVREFREELMRIRTIYEETEEDRKIEDALATCKTLEGMITRLNGIRSNAITTSEELDSRIRAVKQHQQEVEIVLSTEQRQLFADTIADLKKLKAAQEEKAIAWFEERASEVETAKNIIQVLRALESVPPFLPKSYCQKIERMQQRLHERLDENEIAGVVSRFRSISTKEKRIACLRVLLSALQEPQEGKPGLSPTDLEAMIAEMVTVK